jgi:pimeloyl-ACP methyl ester carboxylesterase
MRTGVDGKRVVATRFRRRGGPAYSVRVTRALLAAVGMLSLDACGSCAELVFRLPPRSAKTPREQRALDRAKRRRVAGRWGDIAVWQWGEGPSVLLVYGWGGHAARLTHFVVPLVEAGFGVIAFDAPAHGHSSGSLATLPDFVEAIGVVAPLARPVAVIGHSMGAAAAALALRNGPDPAQPGGDHARRHVPQEIRRRTGATSRAGAWTGATSRAGGRNGPTRPQDGLEAPGRSRRVPPGAPADAGRSHPNGHGS